MGFLSDKIVDGLFIFIGVYFAFHFDQYQQDLSEKRELDFNMTEIINHLPAEPPPQKVARFEIEPYHEKSGAKPETEKEEEIARLLEKKKDEVCNVSVILHLNNYDLGHEYLKVIKNRGLFRHMENKRIISLLSYYYNNLVANYLDMNRKYRDIYEKTLSENFSDPASRCVKEDDVKKINALIAPHYNRVKMAETFLLTVGHEMYQKLNKMGYEPRKKKTMRFSSYLEFVDPEELEKENTEKKESKDSDS